MMHQSEFDAANVALSRAADKRKSLINIHKNRYTATLKKALDMHSFFTFLNKRSFLDLFSEAYFWLENANTKHDLIPAIAHEQYASIISMLVLYQLLLKCTKCQYVEQTVSLLFSPLRKHETRPPCISIP